MYKKIIIYSFLILPLISKTMEHPFAYNPMDYRSYSPPMSPIDPVHAPLSPISASNPHGINIEPEYKELYQVSKEITYSYVGQDSYTPAGNLELYVENDLSLVDDSAHKTAIATFEIPDQHELYHLTEQETKNAQEMFESFDYKLHGKYVSITFRYKDGKLLPVDRAQAIYLVYCPCAEDLLKHNQLSSPERKEYDQRVICPLNATQRTSIHPQQLDQLNSLKRKSEEAGLDISQTSQNKHQAISHQGTTSRQSLVDAAKTEISYQINNANELLTACGVDIKSVDGKIENAHILQAVTQSLDHYIQLFNQSTGTNTKVLFASIIGYLAQIYEPQLFQNHNNDQFEHLREKCKSLISNNYRGSECVPVDGDKYSATINALMKVAHVFSAMEVPAHAIDDVYPLDILEPVLLGQLLSDIEIVGRLRTPRDQALQIKNSLEYISGIIQEKIKHHYMHPEYAHFGGLSSGQISTLTTNALLRTLKAAYSPESTMQPNELNSVLISLLGEDVFNHNESFYPIFFKSLSDNIFHSNGQIYEIHDYINLLHHKILQLNPQTIEEGFSENTPILTQNGYRPIKYTKPGDIIVSINPYTGQEVLCKVLSVVKNKVSRFNRVTLTGQSAGFDVGYNHTFHLKSSNTYKTLTEIKKTADAKNIPGILYVETIELPQGITCELYNLTVDTHYNYQITDKNILVHNNLALPLTTLATYVAAGASASELLVPALIIVGARLIDYTLSQAFGIDIGSIFLNKMDPVAPPSGNTPQIPGGPGGPPLDPNNLPEKIKQAIEASLRYAMEGNKLHHIFEKPMHKLGPLVLKLGSEKEVVHAILIAAYNKLPESGKFMDIPINLEGFTVYIRGIVIDGIVKFGTFFSK